MQPVCQFHQQHADIGGHRQQELAQIFGLALAFGLRFDLRQLGDAIDQPGHICPEQSLDLLLRRHRVLDGVVQDRGGDRLVVQFQVGEDAGHLDWVAEIGVTTGAQLAAMRFHRKHIGAVEEVLIRVGIIGLNPFHQFILAQHSR